jgi:lipopolysaccharide exporter
MDSGGVPVEIISGSTAMSFGSDFSTRRYLARFSAASVSPVLEFAFRFVRTIILSHVLSPDNVGAAVAMASILASCELITDVGIGQFVLISNAKDPAQPVAVAQQIAMSRSLLLGILIIILAPYLAYFFNAGGETSIIRWLAAVPLIRGLRNWRIVQIQNQYQYGPHAIANITAAMGGAIAVIPAALWFHDARAMPVSLGVEAALYTIFSHLLVPRQRVRVVDPVLRRTALSFGLPLVVNGIGLLIISQLDRLIVANLFGLTILAVYSLSLNVVVAPASVATGVLSALAFPFVRRSSTDPRSLRRASLITSLGFTISGAACAVGIGLCLDWLVPLLYGPNYAVSSGFRALITVIAYLRIIRSAPNLILLVRGKTKHATMGNIAAGFGLLIGFVLASWDHRLEAVLFGLLIGDLVSLIVLLIFVRNFFPILALLEHAAVLLVFSVGIAALGPLIPVDSVIVARGIMLGAAAFVIGLDAAFVYRLYVARVAGEPNET